MIVGAGAAGLMAAIHAAGSATPFAVDDRSALATTKTSNADAPGDAGTASNADAPISAASPTSRRRRVLVVEGTRDGGRKILISGGGRCNILPGELDETCFVTDSSPNTMKKMLRSWPLAEQRRFFEEELGVPLRLEPASGKLFPASNRARDVRDALVAAALARGVEFLFETTIRAIEPWRETNPLAALRHSEAEPDDGHADIDGASAPRHSEAEADDRRADTDAASPPRHSQAEADDRRADTDAASPPRDHASDNGGASDGQRDVPRWRLHTHRGDVIDASCVIVATGGLSVPKTGSDGSGFLIARSLGHVLHPTYAALTPLVDADARFADLAGVSLDVTLSAPTPKHPLRSRGGFLFTHRGYSGPSVLDVSHLAVRSGEREVTRALPSESSTRAKDDSPAARTKQKIFVQWTELAREDWEHELAPRRASVLGVVKARMPLRLAEALLRAAEVPGQRSLAELRSDERRRLLDALAHFELPWTGHEGYRTAEVTGGGVALAEVDPRTMESRRAPGLFFCGEVLDAFGPIGGYNFLWAWATGRAAGIGANR